MTLPHDELAEFFSHCRERTEQSLRRWLPAPSDSASARLSEAMSYACLQGGKRVRPVIVYGAVKAAGGKLEDADAAACAVELIHSYSLVHDDLPSMDDDDLRRGVPTVHKAFDEATALLVGDALQALAFQVLAESGGLAAETRLKMVTILARASGHAGMVGGQAVDFEAVGKALELARLESMHGMKTGALIRASVQLGALSAPALGDRQFQALTAYAGHIGLAFQVQDDILDVVADTGTLGKPQGSDQQREKPTYTSLLGLDQAREKAASLAAAAVESLRDFPASADPLRQLADYIVNRSH